MIFATLIFKYIIIVAQISFAYDTPLAATLAGLLHCITYIDLRFGNNNNRSKTGTSPQSHSDNPHLQPYLFVKIFGYFIVIFTLKWPNWRQTIFLIQFAAVAIFKPIFNKHFNANRFVSVPTDVPNVHQWRFSLFCFWFSTFFLLVSRLLFGCFAFQYTTLHRHATSE